MQKAVRKIAVAMSGGVDSSVAALILKRKGKCARSKGKLDLSPLPYPLSLSLSMLTSLSESFFPCQSSIFIFNIVLSLCYCSDCVVTYDL